MRDALNHAPHGGLDIPLLKARALRGIGRVLRQWKLNTCVCVCVCAYFGNTVHFDNRFAVARNDSDCQSRIAFRAPPHEAFPNRSFVGRRSAKGISLSYRAKNWVRLESSFFLSAKVKCEIRKCVSELLYLSLYFFETNPITFYNLNFSKSHKC